MNRLILIGNGFDLAHGLKTSYNDFILDYINSCFTEAWEKYTYSDDIIDIRRKAVMDDFPIGSFRDLSHYLNYFYKEGYSHLIHNNEFSYLSSSYRAIFEVRLKSKLFEHLVLKCRDSLWVDIENEFYNQLKTILHHKYSEDKVKRLNELNNSLGAIIQKLEKHLSKLDNTPHINRYRILFNSQIKNIEAPLGKLDNDELPQKTYIVNFNYTSTIEQYFTPRSDTNVQINYIHGKINDAKNKLVFGFGDELDEDYINMENSGIKGYFEYIKSFWYFKTANYRDLIRFTDSDDFQVFIMGHSCGLSDRTMLHMLFEHANCKSIKIYYHGTEEKNNFTNITYDIARHFSKKGEMRNKIVSEDFTESMPQVETSIKR